MIEKIEITLHGSYGVLYCLIDNKSCGVALLVERALARFFAGTNIVFEIEEVTHSEELLTYSQWNTRCRFSYSGSLRTKGVVYEN